jgi:hypothetical protein
MERHLPCILFYGSASGGMRLSRIPAADADFLKKVTPDLQIIFLSKPPRFVISCLNRRSFMTIKRAVYLAAACVPTLLWAQSPGANFDGTWTTTMACDASTHMPAYQWTFVSTIASNTFHAQHGEEGGPGYLVIDGPVKPDGSAKLHAKGTVQAGKAGLVTQLKGNKYDYYIEATFSGNSGTGKRDEGAGILGRPCSFQFTKQTDTGAAPPLPPPPPPPPAQ